MGQGVLGAVGKGPGGAAEFVIEGAKKGSVGASILPVAVPRVRLPVQDNAHSYDDIHRQSARRAPVYDFLLHNPLVDRHVRLRQCRDSSSDRCKRWIIGLSWCFSVSSIVRAQCAACTDSSHDSTQGLRTAWED